MFHFETYRIVRDFLCGKKTQICDDFTLIDSTITYGIDQRLLIFRVGSRLQRGSDTSLHRGILGDPPSKYGIAIEGGEIADL